jgi:dolichol-phosphate mannosyltransferase
MKTLVVIPTYNERENISSIIPAIFEAAPGVEILVADDNSPDGTQDAVRELQKRFPALHLLSRPGKAGLRLGA